MSTRHGFLVVATLAAALAMPLAGPDARGEVPLGTPVFSDPLEIDNAFFPVEPGNVQVYLGRDEGRRVTIVVSHLITTRDFLFDDRIVPCRVVSELKFESGRLVTEQESYYAQAADGSVWVFGETEDDDEEDDDDDDEDERSGWVVGALAPADPIDTVSVQQPALMMPAAPGVGDVWLSEDAGPGQTQLVEVRSTQATARIRGGRFQGALRVKETVPGAQRGESKWYAPGVGFVRERGGGVRVRLNATTLGGRRR